LDASEFARIVIEDFGETVFPPYCHAVPFPFMNNDGLGSYRMEE
jgi:hypothetical protein